MILTHLNYLNKWIIKYNGKAIAVGDTPAEALGEALRVIKYK